MILRNTKQCLSVVLSFVLISASTQLLYGYPGQEQIPAADTGNPTEPAPSSASELQSLVAPIALYPDSLVAQILTAATFPDQVAIADYGSSKTKVSQGPP
jgi:Protein of unknown function (DUF3300)